MYTFKRQSKLTHKTLFFYQWAIKLHQDHINGPSTIPRYDTYLIPPSNTIMINLVSSVVLMKNYLEKYQQSSEMEKEENKNKFNNMENSHRE